MLLRASTIIKDARLDKGIELSEISQKIKVPLKYLLSIEEEDANRLPQEPYCSLMVKDYAQFLGLDGQRILGLFRRDYAQKRKPQSVIRHPFSFTPKFTFRFMVITSLLLFSGYLLYEYFQFNRPPGLKVNWPITSTVNDSFFDLSGTTDRESTVRVNQDPVIVDHDGGFTKRVSLFPPETKVTVEARSAGGKTTVEEKTIKSAATRSQNSL